MCADTLPKYRLAILDDQSVDTEIAAESKMRNASKVNVVETSYLHHLIDQIWWLFFISNLDIFN